MSLEPRWECVRYRAGEGGGSVMRSLPKRFRPYGFVIAVLTSACAGGAHPDTFPRRYDCGATVITATDGALVVDGADTSVGVRDWDGDHYTVSELEAGAEVEYVVPRDPLLDATVARYGVGDSPDRERRPLLKRGVCVAKGGYTEALQQFMTGVSIAEV